MKRVLALILLSSVPAIASDFQVTKDTIGPFTGSMTIVVRNKKQELTAFPEKEAELTALVRNESGQPIRYAKFCVQARARTKGCDFKLRTNEMWQPGEELTWIVRGKAPRGIESATISLMRIKPEWTR